MNLAACPGCGLPREAATVGKPCPLCGWDPSKPVPAASEPEPAKPAPRREAHEEPPKQPSGTKAMILLTLLVLLGLGIPGTILLWPKGGEQPAKPGELAPDTAQKAKPEPQPPATPPPPKPQIPDPVQPQPPQPPAKQFEIAPDPRAGRLAAAKDDPKPRPGFTVARFLPNDAFTLDGDLAEWKDIPPITLIVGERGKPTKKVITAPKTQKAYIAYSPKGLLLAAEVVDTSGELENVAKPEKGGWAFWDNDALEVFVDTINSRDPDRGATHHHQFFAFPLGTKPDDGAGGYESKIIRRDWNIAPLKGDAAMSRAGRKTDTGWTIEMLIPYPALRQGALTPGNKIGFELQLDTGTNVFYFWACDDAAIRVSMHPHAWGEVTLGGAEAKLEILDSAGKPIQASVPGEPLTVRLTDPDLALSKVATTSIMVRNQAGVERDLTLQETAPNSGVYVGTLATRPAQNVRPANLLELTPDGAIRIDYVEPLRANGDRDRVLRTEFRVKK